MKPRGSDASNMDIDTSHPTKKLREDDELSEFKIPNKKQRASNSPIKQPSKDTEISNSFSLLQSAEDQTAKQTEIFDDPAPRKARTAVKQTTVQDQEDTPDKSPPQNKTDNKSPRSNRISASEMGSSRSAPQSAGGQTAVKPVQHRTTHVNKQTAENRRSDVQNFSNQQKSNGKLKLSKNFNASQSSSSSRGEGSGKQS